MLVGSLASNVHGIPRSTQDADLVIDVGPGRLTDLARVLPPPLVLDEQAAFEGVNGTTRHVIRLAGSAFVCELFHLSDDPHDQERFRRRMSIPALGRHPWIATAEDMIVTKLRWSLEARRVKDRWTVGHGTRALLDELRRSVPPGSP